MIHQFDKNISCVVVACNMNSLTKKPYVDEYDSSREERKMRIRKKIEKGEGGW